MTIPDKKIYPRTNDRETVYLKNVIKNPDINDVWIGYENELNIKHYKYTLSKYSFNL